MLKGDWQEEPRVIDLPLPEQPRWGSAWAAEQFCDWIRDSEQKPAHRLKEYMQTAAITFAAIESARISKAVDVQEYLNEQLRGA